MTTTVHNCLRGLIRRGDVYVGRFARSIYPQGIEGADGYFGNPWKIGKDDRDEVIDRYERYARERLETDPEWRRRVRDLHGRRLFCWCAPARCHADVLVQLAAELHRDDALADQPDIDDEIAADRMADDGGPA